MAPSHNLFQCWNILNWTLGNKLQWNFNHKFYIFIQENAFEKSIWKMAAILSQPPCVKFLYSLQRGIATSHPIRHNKKQQWQQHIFLTTQVICIWKVVTILKQKASYILQALYHTRNDQTQSTFSLRYKEFKSSPLRSSEYPCSFLPGQNEKNMMKLYFKTIDSHRASFKLVVIMVD